MHYYCERSVCIWMDDLADNAKINRISISIAWKVVRLNFTHIHSHTKNWSNSPPTNWPNCSATMANKIREYVQYARAYCTQSLKNHFDTFIHAIRTHARKANRSSFDPKKLKLTKQNIKDANIPNTSFVLFHKWCAKLFLFASNTYHTHQLIQ